MPILSSTLSTPYVPAVPGNVAGFGNLDRLYNADFPGIFNADKWMQTFFDAIDTAALNQYSIEFQPPVVVLVPSGTGFFLSRATFEAYTASAL